MGTRRHLISGLVRAWLPGPVDKPQATASLPEMVPAEFAWRPAFGFRWEPGGPRHALAAFRCTPDTDGLSADRNGKVPPIGGLCRTLMLRRRFRALEVGGWNRQRAIFVHRAG